MGYCRETSLPEAEPISLALAKTQLRLNSTFTADDPYISGLITAAREHAELWTGRAIAQRTFRMVLDSAPYYTDTIQSQLAFPPSYYSLPRYSTTLWNYSQMIKLPFSPVISVQQMRYIDTNGNPQVMQQDLDFTLDRISEPSRIFPGGAGGLILGVPGSTWPANLYVANALEIDFTAGYVPTPNTIDEHEVEATPPNQQPDSVIVTTIPAKLVRLMLLIITNWYDNRTQDVPDNLNLALQAHAVVDWAPTRG